MDFVSQGDSGSRSWLFDLGRGSEGFGERASVERKKRALRFAALQSVRADRYVVQGTSATPSQKGGHELLYGYSSFPHFT